MTVLCFCKKKPLDESMDNFIIKRIEYDKSTKRILRFSIVQIHYRNETPYEIIKIDTSHGALHIHRFYQNPKHAGDCIIDKEISYAAFDEFSGEIMQNWRKYLKLYLERWLK